MRTRAVLTIFLIFFLGVPGGIQAEDFAFTHAVSVIPPDLAERMEKCTWKPGCPVPISDLRLISVSCRRSNQTVHQGRMIVHRSAARELVDIFAELFREGFVVEKMNLIEEYGGDDNLSMADNNTSAFNCRMAVGTSNRFSRHSYGLAVDINPKWNPYVKGRIILPPAGRDFLDRRTVRPGLIVKGGPCYRAFVNRGWRWGGDWKTLKDYQHFEKDF